MPLDATSAPADSLTGLVSLPSLADRTMSALREFFDGKGHHPSGDHYSALRAIAETMEAMVVGACPARIYLSPCDPGIGKSRTVVQFAQELVSDPTWCHAGMIISVFTIDEAKAMAEALAAIRPTLCVLTSDAAANDLGGADANDAQVLITTQNRLGLLTQERPFASVAAFHYQGEPRACRVWDESVLPGSAIVIGADDLIGMATRLRGFSPALVEALYTFGATLLALKDGAAVMVPDFGSGLDIALPDVVAHLAADNGTDARSRDRETATALAIVNGRRVRVRRDGRNGSAMLTFREELPDDLPPMLVLDASGRVRETYALWQESRQALTLLPEAVRDYSQLTVKAWKTSGAKSGWEKNGARLVEGVVATIMSKPEERWLVVVHRPNGTVGDPENAIRSKLPPGVRERVEFTTWGRHHGVNRWSAVPNVILAGTLFYPSSHLTALHHLCANIPIDDGLVGTAEVRRTQRGEHRHLILQAVCRGRVRQSDGPLCQPMTAYVIASPKSGIPTELEAIFPGCTVEPWTPLKVEATGKLREAIRFMTTAIEEGRLELSFAEVADAIGVDKANFNKRVAKTDAWKAAVEGLDAEIVTGARGSRWVRVLTPEG